MGALEDIAVWVGSDPATVGWIVGIVLILVVTVSVSIATESTIATLVCGFAMVIVLLIFGLWPSWVAIVIVLGMAVLLVVGMGNKSGGD